MANKQTQNMRPDEPLCYQIRIKGHLGCQWTEWFDGLTITLEENGDTLLTGPVADQATLHGLLKKIRDLGLPLLSVFSLDSDGRDATENAQTNKNIYKTRKEK